MDSISVASASSALGRTASQQAIARCQAPNALQPAPVGRQTSLHVHWAKDLDEVRQAQQLRYRVFAQEMGARLSTPLAGHDVDHWDDYCEHLLVRDTSTEQVV